MYHYHQLVGFLYWIIIEKDIQILEWQLFNIIGSFANSWYLYIPESQLQSNLLHERQYTEDSTRKHYVVSCEAWCTEIHITTM